jgi:hypothetical protein
MKPRLMLLWITLLAVASGCNTQTDTIAQLPTATLGLPIVSLTPRFTATPFNSRTPLPTPTYTPSITPIPPTSTNTPTVTPTPVISGIVASLQSVNLRTGPGESYSAFQALTPGTGVVILGRNDDGSWYNVQLTDGTEGWMSARLLRVNEPPTPFPTATPSPDLTAIALGTPLPTALLGAGTITATPPPAAVTATPAGNGSPDPATLGLLVSSTPNIPLVGAGTGTATPNTLSLATPIPNAVVGANPNFTPSVNVPRIDLNAINQTATQLASSISLPRQMTPTFTPFIPGGVTPGAQATVAPLGTAVQQRGVDILAYCTEFGIAAPNNLAVGSVVDIFWGWYARTPDLVQQHVDNAVYEVRVNGQILSQWRQYASRVELESDGNYHIYWYVPFELTSAGQYQVTYRVSWSNTISDGFDNFGPGTRNPLQTGSCTFTVR